MTPSNKAAKWLAATIVKTTQETQAKLSSKNKDQQDNIEYSDKAKRIVRLIAISDFGCQRRSVRSLVEQIIDEPLPELPNDASEEGNEAEPDFAQNLPSMTAYSISELPGTVFVRFPQHGDLDYNLELKDEETVVNCMDCSDPDYFEGEFPSRVRVTQFVTDEDLIFSLLNKNWNENLNTYLELVESFVDG